MLGHKLYIANVYVCVYSVTIMHFGYIRLHIFQLTTCNVCQRMNRKLTSGIPEMHPISVKAPWYMLGIDFIGPLSPASEDGSKYILTISDYFAKWVEVIPTKDKMAVTVANCLFKVS